MSNQLSEASSHRLLYIMAIAGLVLISFFGFFPHWLTGRTHVAISWLCLDFGAIDHWQCWELGALLWSFLFGFYYYLTFPFTRKDSTDRLLAGILPLFTFGLCGFAVVFLLRRSDSLHFVFVLLIGIFFGGADVLLYKKHAKDSPHKKPFKESLYLADLPMIVALGFLLVFHFLHRHPENKEEMDAFLAGGISFQLIVSNWIFVFSQLGLFRRIWVPD